MAALLSAAVLAAVIGFIVLPETLVMQLSANGQAANTMIKPVGLLIPFAITAIFAVMFFRNEPANPKLLVGSIVGIVAFILTFAFNL